MRQPVPPPRLTLLAAYWGALRGADGGLCSSTVGAPPAPHTAHDGGDPVQIIDRSFVLPAGTITDWQLYNHGAAAGITLQAWRPIGDARTFELVCTMDATLKAGLQTIPISGVGCDVEDGDSIGWWQKGGSVTGGIAIATTVWDPSCNPKTPRAQCKVCNNAYNGALWVYPSPATTLGGRFTAEGCGPRTYSVSVTMAGECFAWTGGAEFVAIVIGVAALYLGVGMGLRRRQGAQSWQEALPHQRQWLQLLGLVQDGVVFARSRARGQRGAAAAGLEAPLRSAGDRQERGGRSSREQRPVKGGEDSRGKEKKSKGKKRAKEKRGSSPSSAAPPASAPAPAAAAAPASGTAAGDGGRWVHIPN